VVHKDGSALHRRTCEIIDACVTTLSLVNPL
jgi:hypothetical protein